MNYKQLKYIPIIFIILISYYLLNFRIDKPFYGHHEWNGVFYSNIARNYLRYGYLETRLGEVVNYGLTAVKDFRYHTNHPVLYPIMLSLWFKISGVSEASARLMSILFSISSLFIVNLILLKFYSFKKSYLIILVSIFTPLFLYYAKMPVYEPAINFFILLTIYFYLNWRSFNRRLDYLLIIICLFISQMIEWPGYYLSFILFFHFLFFKPKNRKYHLGMLFFAPALIGFLLVNFHQYLLTKQIGGKLLNIFFQRLSLNSPQPFTLIDFIMTEFNRLRSFFTSSLLLLAFFWTIGYILKLVRKKKILAKIHFVSFFLVFGVIHILIFPNVAWYHDYMLYYFFYPVVLAGGLFLKSIFKINKRLGYLVFLVALIISYFEKKQFLTDLKKMSPYYDCVLWGKQINQGIREPLIQSNDSEKINLCPPFTQYYADQQVEFKLLKNPNE